MSHKVVNHTIDLTRGDSLILKISIMDADGNEYIPKDGDRIRFAMNREYTNGTPPLILKDIPIDTMVLRINPEDTKTLGYGSYVFDIELSNAHGDVDTFIDDGILRLTKEVW